MNPSDIESHLELLAPAGSWEALHAAMQAGADAVYFGVNQLNMRVRAARCFLISDLKKIGRLCQKQKVKSYLALNTLVYDHEISLLETICTAAKKAGISAIIATDMAAVEIARAMDLEVHISTQANISNFSTVRFYACYADVLVLARELSLSQITEICKKIRKEKITGPNGQLIRIELFIHGALCIAIAGKCHMSLALTGHSANRGDCFQICRRKYQVMDVETGQKLELDNQFVMSPADLCTIGIIDKLIASGATVFKIEGRGRPADYVYRTTRIYREAIDSMLNHSYNHEKIDQWRDSLKSVFNRNFWENGYYLGEPLGEWSGAYGSQATKQKTFVGKVINYFQKAGIAQIEILSGTLHINDIIAITGNTTGYAESLLESLFVDEAPALSAEKDQKITFPFPQKVRPNDKVYVIRERTDWQT